MRRPIAGPNRLDVALGVCIRQRRKVIGLSQTALAEAVGLTFQQIQKYERGFNRVSFSRLVAIAHALRCPVIDLIDGLDAGGDTPSLVQLDTQHLGKGGAIDLLTAYAVLPPTLQKAVQTLVRELAKDHRMRAAA